MATVKKVEVVNEKQEVGTVNKAEYDSLKSQFDELKAMLLDNISKQKEDKAEAVADTSDKDEEELESEELSIAPHTMINVTNLYFGELYLQGIDSKVIKFPAFGVTLPMTYADVAHAQSQARSFAEDGHFYIHNKKAVKTLYLEDAYKKFIQKDKLINIYKLSETQIRDMVLHTTDSIKDTIANMTIATIIEDDKKAYDKKKIKDNTKILLIGELLNIDLMKEAKKLIEA